MSFKNFSSAHPPLGNTKPAEKAKDAPPSDQPAAEAAKPSAVAVPARKA